MKYDIGYKIGNIEVVDKIYDKTKNKYWFYCKCSLCGRVDKHGFSVLRALKGNGCHDCYNKLKGVGAVKHTRLYNVWRQMKHRCRCTENDHSHWKHYGSRGIDICKEWESYAPFKKWAEENGWTEDSLYSTNRNKLTIDRIDNDSDYCPENCRIITHRENQRNKRNTIKVSYQGKIYTIPELAEVFNIKNDVLYHRIKSGWEEEDWNKPVKRSK